MIGVDALRYSLARYPADSPLTSTSTEITRQTNDNPVFYVQYAHARLSAILRNAADLGMEPAEGDAFDPALLTHEQEGDLLRALAEFPRVVAAAAQLREPHRVARYLEDTAVGVPQVLRHLPGAADGRRGAGADSTGRGCCSSTATAHGARQRPAACSASPPPSGCERGACPRGRLGARRRRAARPGLAARARATSTRWSRCCGRSTARKNDDGVARGRRRRRCATSSPSTAPRRTSSTRPTSGPGPGPSATAFGDYDVFYAGKAFLCTTVARWVAEEGLCLDVCSGGELTVALRAGFDPARIGYHGNNKTTAELRRAVEAGVGRIVVDSFHEIDRLAARDRGDRGDGPR